jgi:hypothetical protein
MGNQPYRALAVASGFFVTVHKRAQALLQLRCTDQDGEWDAFIASVHEQVRLEATTQCEAQTILDPLAPAKSSREYVGKCCIISTYEHMHPTDLANVNILPLAPSSGYVIGHELLGT